MFPYVVVIFGSKSLARPPALNSAGGASASAMRESNLHYRASEPDPLRLDDELA